MSWLSKEIALTFAFQVMLLLPLKAKKNLDPDIVVAIFPFAVCPFPILALRLQAAGKQQDDLSSISPIIVVVVTHVGVCPYVFSSLCLYVCVCKDMAAGAGRLACDLICLLSCCRFPFVK